MQNSTDSKHPHPNSYTRKKAASSRGGFMSSRYTFSIDAIVYMIRMESPYPALAHDRLTPKLAVLGKSLLPSLLSRLVALHSS